MNIPNTVVVMRGKIAEKVYGIPWKGRDQRAGWLARGSMFVPRR